MSYIVVARWRAKPGERAKVETLLRQLTEAVRSEPGNLGFVVHRLREDADEFLLYETYKDEAAFLAHREMTHFKNLVIAEAVPRLERREIQSYALLD
jgi:quinol monooxygenase YgiN